MWDVIYWTFAVALIATVGGFTILVMGACIMAISDWVRDKWVRANTRRRRLRDVPPPAPIVRVGPPSPPINIRGSRSYADFAGEMRAGPPREPVAEPYQPILPPTAATDEILTHIETALRDSVVLGTNHAREQEEAMRDAGFSARFEPTARYEPIAPIGAHLGGMPHPNYASFLANERQHTATYNGQQILIQSLEQSIHAGGPLEIKLSGILVPLTTQHPRAPEALGDRHPIVPEQEEMPQATTRQLRGIRVRENG